MDTPWDWNPYLMGGAARSDAISGLGEGFNTSLQSMFAAAPPDIQAALRLNSAYRSPERQAQLYDEAIAKYGSPEAARKWVAPPGKSQHNHGSAVDLKYLDPAAQTWAHENAAKFGLTFPMAHEPWHIEPVGARGGHAHATDQGAAAPPTAAVAAPAPEETMKLFGFDTGVSESGLADLSAALSPKMEPMQAPQVQRGPGYVKQTDGLARALEAFNQTRQNRR